MLAAVPGISRVYARALLNRFGSIEAIMSAGPDTILGTADDVVMSLRNMTRTIAIIDVPGESGLRQISITITYTVGSMSRQYTLVSFIAQFS